MFELRQTDVFDKWFGGLRDRSGRARIRARLDRLELGQIGDVKFFDGIGELRIDHGPGYRLYFVRRGTTIIVLLCGGDKSTQVRDIERAQKLAMEV